MTRAKKAILITSGIVISFGVLRPFWLPIVFVPNLLPENSIRPLEWITRSPEVQKLQIPHNNQILDADLYLPKSKNSPQQILLLVHGANEQGKNDERIINFGQSLARAGVATLVPTFPDILRSSFAPESTGQVSSALKWMRKEHPKASIKMISFSVAGGPMLIAANNQDLNFDLIVAFGSHYDLKNVLKYITTKTFEYGGQIYTNEPDPFAKELLKTQYDQRFGQDPAIEALFSNTDPARFDELYENLSPEVRRFLSDLSPAGHLDNIKAEKILIAHSKPDLIIPHTESMRLKEMLAEKAELTFLQIFSHVNIQFPKFTPSSVFNYYLPEAGKLYKIIYQVIK